MPAEVFKPNESFGLARPEFDCGKFTMVFSTEPEGFEVMTDKSLPRRSGITPLQLKENEAQILRTAIRNQFGYTTADQAKLALDTYRRDPSEPNRKEFEEKRKQYYDNKSIVTGIHNVRRDPQNPNKIILDTRPLNLPFASLFSKPESPDYLKEMVSSHASTTFILRTSDNKGILQVRSPGQGWPLTAAASASGYIDELPFEKENIPHEFMDENVKTTHLTRALKKLTTQEVKDNALRELDEEIGLDSKEVFDVRIGGMIHERGNLHDEFVLTGKTNLTSVEVVEHSANAARSKKLRPGEHREKFITFDLDPENIENLLTKVKSPLPHSHCAAYINAGYELMLEKGSKTDALSWRRRVEQGVKKNYADIDRLVASHYVTFNKSVNEVIEKMSKENPNLTAEQLDDERTWLMIPERLRERVNDNITKFKTLNPSATKEQTDEERKRQIAVIPKRNPNGYSTGYTPEEQGLESFYKALDTGKFRYQKVGAS